MENEREETSEPEDGKHPDQKTDYFEIDQQCLFSAGKWSDERRSRHSPE